MLLVYHYSNYQHSAGHACKASGRSERSYLYTPFRIVAARAQNKCSEHVRIALAASSLRKE